MTDTPLPPNGFSVADLVGLTLRQIGVGALGTTAQPEDIRDAVMQLNMLLGQWQRKRWIVPNLIDRSFKATGQNVYTIGPGGDLSTPSRPAQIKAAYARQLREHTTTGPGDFDSRDFMADFLIERINTVSTTMPMDYPLSEIPSYEDYSAISLKSLQSFPGLYHYNPAFPYGEFRPWPLQWAGWEYHVLFTTPLPAHLAPDDEINLPPEYQDALMWTLAARIAPSYGQEASQTVIANARIAQNTLRQANTQIPSLSLPSALQPYRAPFYWPGLRSP